MCIFIYVYICTCVLHRMPSNVARWLEFPCYRSPQSVPSMCVQAMSASEVHVGVVMYRFDKLVSAAFQTHRQRQDSKHVLNRHGLQIGAGHLAFYW